MSDSELPVWLEWAGAISPVGLVALFVLFIFTGRILPQRTVHFLAEERDKRMQDLRREADQWRQASELKDETIAAMQSQYDTLLEHAEVTVVLLRAIKNDAG